MFQELPHKVGTYLISERIGVTCTRWSKGVRANLFLKRHLDFLVGSCGLHICRSVAKKEKQSESTRAIREVNRRVLEDARVEASLIPVGDGILLATKR